MDYGFSLDVSSFQELLLAAWVLQCERDAELNQLRNGGAHPILTFQAAELRPVASPASPVDLRTLSGESEKSSALQSKKRAFPRQTGRRVAIKLVRPEGKEQVLFSLNLVNLKQLQEARTYAGPVSVLLIMVLFLLSLMGSHSPVLTSVSAAPQALKPPVDESKMHDSVRRALFSLNDDGKTAQNASGFETGHRQVTDASISGVVGNLSRYEIPNLRRQAQYGDDVAALTLGMAYETGHQVPQSCVQAAHWIAVAATAGNAAAEYNLGLRYLNGDGTPVDSDEAKKWLQAAADHGYPNAENTLQRAGL